MSKANCPSKRKSTCQKFTVIDANCTQVLRGINECRLDMAGNFTEKCTVRSQTENSPGPTKKLEAIVAQIPLHPHLSLSKH
jgi:hypothetical protein